MELDHGSEIKRIDVMQDDKYSRDLEVTLKSNMKEFYPPKGCTLLVRYAKPNQQGGAYDTLPNGEKAWCIEGNKVTVRLAPQVCTTAGEVMLTVSMMDGESELSCFSVCVNVHERPGKVLKNEQYINISSFIPQPDTAEVGQYLKVAEMDPQGRITGLTTGAEIAQPGKSAYEYAQEAGYTGTETAFSAKLAEEAPKAFYMVLWFNGVSFDTDTSLEDLEKAYQAGKPLYCICPYDGIAYCLPLGFRMDDGSIFAFGNTSPMGALMVICSAAGVSVTKENYPTKTSHLLNDSGFITANQVPRELPAVTIANNGAYLRVVNGVWTVASGDSV